MLGFVDDRALDFDDATRYRDACFLGDCDDGVKQLAEHLDAAFAAVDGGGGGAATASGDGEGTSTGGAAAADGEVPLPAERGWAASLRHRADCTPQPVSSLAKGKCSCMRCVAVSSSSYRSDAQ